jgi:hypothetical protein
MRIHVLPELRAGMVEQEAVVGHQLRRSGGEGKRGFGFA